MGLEVTPRLLSLPQLDISVQADEPHGGLAAEPVGKGPLSSAHHSSLEPGRKQVGASLLSGPLGSQCLCLEVSRKLDSEGEVWHGHWPVGMKVTLKLEQGPALWTGGRCRAA